MAHQLFLKPLFFAAAIFLFTVEASSQNGVIAMKDSTALRSYSATRGDTLYIAYDSAYVLNKRTFKLYQDNYKRVQAGNPSLKKLLDEYENLIALQDTMLKEKERYYQGLKSNFDSLLVSSNRFADRTDVNITTINQSLSTATNQINNIKVLLDDSLKKLNQESRKKFKWALGGFTVGVGVASVAFLILK
jgi:hypothetical protein